MPRLVWVVASLSFVAFPAPAEIFKCTIKDGAVIYQNFKCEVDSLGSMPSAPTLNTPAPAPAHDTSTLKSKDKDAARPVVADARSKPGTLRVGMTMDEVRSLFGEPTETFQDELVEGRVEIWAYGSRSLKFNVNGRVTEILQP